MFQKNFILLTIISSFFFIPQGKSQTFQPNESETKERLLQGISVLAADSLMGREAGTQYEIKAANYIAAQFKKIGIDPLVNDTSYMHSFDFFDGYDYKQSVLILNGKKYTPGKDFYPLAITAEGKIEGTIIRAGKGNVNEADSINVFNREKVENPVYAIEIQENGKLVKSFNEYAIEKVKSAEKYGAKAVVFINPSKFYNNPTDQIGMISEKANIPVIFADQLAFKVIMDATHPKIELEVKLQQKKKQAHNVVGFLDNEAGKTIIIGAHYDHLGMGGPTSRYMGDEKQIHNGADDNASGTVGVVELARFYQNNNQKENHNFIFIAFSAEEKGLIGSTKFAKSNHYNPGKVNCMINLDMIGRLDSLKKNLYIMGTGTSPVWDTLLNNTNIADSLMITTVSSGMGGSDHTPFYMKNIPVLFFFTGMHKDYHMPTDDIEKLNFQGQVDVLNYIQKVIAKLDKSDKIPFAKTEMPSRGKKRFKGVTLGFMPDHAFQGTGVRINAVSEGKSADKAGLKNGDIIIAIDDHLVKEIRSYMKALGDYKKGDKATVKFIREDKEKSVEVIF